MGYVSVLFACICLCDYLWHRIPNLLLAVFLLLGEWTALQTRGVEGLLSYNGVMLFAGCGFYLFFQIGALGAGDVKLIAVTSGFLPLERIPLYLLVGFALAAGMSAMKILRGGRWKERMRVLGTYLQEVALYRQAVGYPTELGEAGTCVCLAGPFFVSFLLVGGVL